MSDRSSASKEYLKSVQTQANQLMMDLQLFGLRTGLLRADDWNLNHQIVKRDFK